MRVCNVTKILALEESGIKYVMLVFGVSFQWTILGGDRNVLMVKFKDMGSQRSLVQKSCCSNWRGSRMLGQESILKAKRESGKQMVNIGREGLVCLICRIGQV